MSEDVEKVAVSKAERRKSAAHDFGSFDEAADAKAVIEEMISSSDASDTDDDVTDEGNLRDELATLFQVYEETCILDEVSPQDFIFIE